MCPAATARTAFALIAAVLTLPLFAQQQHDTGGVPHTPPAAQPSSASEAQPSNQTLSEASVPTQRAERASWPRPVIDDETYSFVLFDLLEYQRVREVDALRWDILAWRGGDQRRFWFKSEGTRYIEPGAGGQADLQFLYGKLVSPFFDLQAGLRFEQHDERDATPQRGFLVLGLQGLAPYRFEIEPALFLSNKGKVSGRFTASTDWFLTQRTVLQPRLETEFALQKDEPFGVESGINDVELGLRLRYEFRRQFAPYLGVSFRQNFGATRERILREGGQPNSWQLMLGARAWF